MLCALLILCILLTNNSLVPFAIANMLSDLDKEMKVKNPIFLLIYRIQPLGFTVNEEESTYFKQLTSG